MYNEDETQNYDLEEHPIHHSHGHVVFYNLHQKPENLSKYEIKYDL